MKASIVIVTTRKEFRQDQLAIIKRVLMVLSAHDMEVEIVNKKQEKLLKSIKLLKIA